MASSDEEVRGNLRKLIEAFATPDQRAERSGFHLYCLQVAMGFKKIYRELHNNKEPPGLQKDELQKNSVHVSYAITVSEIDQWKTGDVTVHDDVKDVLDKIAELKTNTTSSLKSVESENLRLTQENALTHGVITDAVTEWGLELDRRVKNKEITWKAESGRLHLEIDKLKKDRSGYESTCNKQVADMERQMDAANAALKIAERDNADLKSKIFMSSQLDRIERDLKGALSRLEGSDGILVSYIKLLLSDKNASGNPVAFVTPATADLVKSLMPKEISSGITSADIAAKNAEIESLKQSKESLETDIATLKAELEAERGKVAAAALLATDLSAAQTEAKILKSSLEEYKSSIKTLQVFLKTAFNFGKKLKLTERAFELKVVDNHVSYIDSTTAPMGISGGDWKQIQKNMKLYAQLIVVYVAYFQFKGITTLMKDNAIIKNMQTIWNSFSIDDAQQKAFTQLSAASFGFASIEQAIACLDDAEVRMNLNNNQEGIFQEESVGTPSDPNFVLTIKTRDADEGTSPPRVVRIIDFAVNKFCLLSSAMAFAATWMGNSTDSQTKLDIAALFPPMVEMFSPHSSNSQVISLLEYLKGQNLTLVLKFFPPVMFGQILYQCIPQGRDIVFRSKKSEKVEKCHDAMVKYIESMVRIRAKKTDDSVFNPSDIKILDLLHCNNALLTKS